MSRLRHPVRSIREPFGKAGLTVAILALVLAMVGGAWAAVGLNGKQKKEVKSIAKQFAGKPGANGATGPAGTNGTNGTNGKDGTNGTDGAPGTSVTVASLSSPNCEGRAGAKFTVGAQEAKACNGKDGSPWTAGGTLPKGSTETGTFLAPVGVTEEEGAVVFSNEELATISFPIPLAAELDGAHLHYVTREEWVSNTPPPPSQCLNGTADEPEAEEGNLCVYEGVYSAGVPLGVPAFLKLGSFGPGSGKTGTFLLFTSEAPGSRFVGTWAVTAP